MTTVDEPFPDIERVLVDYLAQLGPTGDQTPESLEAPFIRVQRIGGYDDGLTDRPRVEVATYAPTRRESQALAERARQLVLACDSTDAAGIHIDRVLTEAQTGRTPYENEDVRRIAAVFRLSIRRTL